MSSNFKVIRNVELKVCVQTCEAGLKVCMQTCETRLKVGCKLAREVESSSCSLRAVAGNITSEHPLHVHIGSKDRRGIWHTRDEPADRRYRSGKGTCQFPVLAGCHEQAVRFRRLRVISLQRTRSMCTLEPRIAGASGTHAMKLRIEVRRQTCQLSCTC